jgi:DNA-directed RNA polymerase
LTTLAREKGRNKARKEWRDAKESGGETRAKPGSLAVRRIVNGLMDLLTNALEAREGGRRAVPHGRALRHLEGAPIPEVCLAVARAAVNGMMTAGEWMPGITMQSKLGAAAEDAILAAKWKKLDPFQAEAVRARLGHSTDPLKRRMARRAYSMGWARELEAHDDGWDEKTTKAIGTAFMDYLVQLGMFEHHKGLVATGKRRTNGVRLTETAAHWISNAAEFEAASAEVFFPTLDPPVAWTHPYGGGFHGRGELDHPSVPRNQRPFWIVKNARKEHKAMLLKADLSTVYAALNLAQATGWRINARVYEVFEELRRIGRGEAGLALAEPAHKPERHEAAEHSPEEHENFLATRRDYYAAERKMMAKRIAEFRIFDTARLFKDAESFHFVYALDFRGRAYAQSDYLSPQGRDLERGLLEFSEGDEMTDDGAWWLKIHLANTCGKDKESLEERIRWADLNSDWFCRIAASPLDTVREWGKADAPWQFLAACFAWADYVNGERLCRLPVMLDGSCSGIQHSAALVRDMDAGSRVNLVPRRADEKPADIYADVADRANAILAEKAAALDTRAYRWRYEWTVTRADTKASVMTLPYGGTEFGNRDKVRKSVEKQIRKAKKARPDWLSLDKDNRTERGAAFKVLSDAVWQAMSEIIRAPITVMDFFKDCAGAMRDRERVLQRDARKAKAAEPHLRFAWTSPCGFPVLADYRVSKKRRTTLKDANGRTITYEYYAASEATDWNTAKDRAPPNVVHSLDASHLLRTLAKSSGAGIDRVAIVHDAFGTTPAKVGALAQLLREEFVEMYSGDVLGETLGRMLVEAGAVRPKAPVRGSLDLSGVLDAPYVFA